MKLGGKATEEVTEAISAKFGEAAWAKAQKVWQQLSPKVEEKEDMKIAAIQVVAKPDSQARQALFQEELETLLNKNLELTEAIAKIMEEDTPDGTPGTQIIQTVTGDKNQTIGQVFGGTIVDNVEGDVRI